MIKIVDSKQKTANRGYTLVELMVSVGLFAIVMVLVAGAYFMIISVSQQAQAISTAVDGVSYSLEDVSRTIRTGTAWGCPSPKVGYDCPGGDSSIIVTDQTGTNQQTFSLITLPNGNGAIAEQSGSGAVIPLTDPAVNITSLVFYVVGTQSYSGSGNTDITPPHATIVVSGTISTGKVTIPFTVETGATMRGIDL